MAAARPFPVSDHCDGRRFFNPGGHVNRNWFDVLRWKLSSRPSPWPRAVPLDPTPPLPPAPRDGTLHATLINHASVLLQTRWGNLLTDPIYSDRASPVPWAGPTRVHPPGIAWVDLPEIHAVLLSHDHYDHCDLPTLRRLVARFPRVQAVTLLGNGDLLQRAGFPPAQITELDWWQPHPLGEGFHLRATPSRHWSNRLSGRRNHRLWGGFYLHAGGRTACFVGDTGYDETLFKTIADRYGPPDLALIPIGAYAPRWFMSPQHCNPAEAVRIHQDLGAKTSLALHWGTFQLTDEARDEPARALATALATAGLPAAAFRAASPGTTLKV